MSTAHNLEDAPATSSTTSTTMLTPASNVASPSPVPPNYQQQQNVPQERNTSRLQSSLLLRVPHRPRPSWSKPRLNLRVQDVSHPAAKLFFQAFVSTEVFEEAVDSVLTVLYEAPDKPLGEASKRPPVRSITLVLRSMDGVAYTTGNDELGDDNHKEIHFSLEHIKNVMNGTRRSVEEKRKAASPENSSFEKAAHGEQEHDSASTEVDMAVARATAAEIRGVLVHEMVHCWQWNGGGTAPGGLVEGVADYVRLKEGLAPPHWSRENKGDRWDAGYERTAFFLEWCEKHLGSKGEGKVRDLNLWLQSGKYDDEKTWKEIFGASVGKLWSKYLES